MPVLQTEKWKFSAGWVQNDQKVIWIVQDRKLKSMEWDIEAHTKWINHTVISSSIPIMWQI